jgi:predicted proteasome-type protease
MTNITVSLPDELAQRVQQAGLLSSPAIVQLLEEAMRRRAGRQLLDIAKRVQAAGIPPMSDEEVVAEVKAVRAERRARALKDKCERFLIPTSLSPPCSGAVHPIE